MSFAGTVSSGPLAALLRSLGDEPEAGGCKSRANRNVANAMGLVRFPCPPGTLMNTYHLIRAGESGYEANDVLITNPLFLTNREDALTDLGIIQVEEACNEMMSKGINPSVVKYSLAAKCIDTVNIMATNMMIGRNRIVPEFTFMDQRQAGLWDGKPLSTTEPAMFALDATEAGKEGRDGRPPANEDGTANETLYDQVVRLRQLMSILETQYSGDEIVLVFPDGGSPALLSCLIAGIPLNKCHALNFAPGEIRFNVNMENSLKLLDEKISSPEYNDAVTMGNEQLVALRTAPVEEEEKKILLIHRRQRRPKPLQSNRANNLSWRRRWRQMGKRKYQVRQISFLLGPLEQLDPWQCGMVERRKKTRNQYWSGALSRPSLLRMQLVLRLVYSNLRQH